MRPEKLCEGVCDRGVPAGEGEAEGTLEGVRGIRARRFWCWVCRATLSSYKVLHRADVRSSSAVPRHSLQKSQLGAIAYPFHGFL